VVSNVGKTISWVFGENGQKAKTGYKQGINEALNGYQIS
jgi:hypothetical protein